VQCLEGLLLCPVSRTAIYLGKLLASLILAFGSGFVVLVFFTVLYDVGLNLQWLALLGVMLLATVGLAAVGTLFAAITTGVRARGALLTIVVLGQEPWEGLGLWPVLMVLYDVIFLAVGILTFDFVVE
jgi:heme exporter protein B